MATDHQPDGESEKNGDGYQQKDLWDSVEKGLPLLAFAMEGQTLTTKIAALVMLVLVIRGTVPRPRDK